MNNSFVVGIDPGKYFFSTILVDSSGQAVGSVRELPMSESGFEDLVRDLPAGRITFAVEASGRVDDNLLAWLGKWKQGRDGVSVVRANPGQSSRFPGAKPRRDQTDGTDAAQVALYVRFFADQLETFEQDPKAQAMARLMSERQRLALEIAAVKNRFQEQLLICFPEFTQEFEDPLGGMARTVLREGGPTAAELSRRQALSLARLKANRRSRSLGVDRARRLLHLAQHSIASATEKSDGQALIYLLDQLALLEGREQAIDQAIRTYIDEEKEKVATAGIVSLARQMELADSMPGIAQVTAAHLVLGTRGLARFTRSKALAAQWASCPERIQTGVSLKKTKLTSRGDHKRRSFLFLATQAACENDPAFAFHKWRLIRNGLRPMQAVCACMNRMARVLWSLVAHDQLYDPNRMLEQILIHHSQLWKTFLMEQAGHLKIWKKVDLKWRKTA